MGHSLPTTRADITNADLLAFIQRNAQSAAAAAVLGIRRLQLSIESCQNAKEVAQQASPAVTMGLTMDRRRGARRATRNERGRLAGHSIA